MQLLIARHGDSVVILVDVLETEPIQVWKAEAVAGGSREGLQSAAARKTPDFSFPADLELD